MVSQASTEDGKQIIMSMPRYFLVVTYVMNESSTPVARKSGHVLWLWPWGLRTLSFAVAVTSRSALLAGL